MVGPDNKGSGDSYRVDLPHRRAIAQAVDGLFGHHVDIDDRAYRALEIVRWEGKVAQAHDVWLNAGAIFPGLDTFNERLGLRRFRPPRHQRFTDATVDDDDPEHWTRTLIPLLFHHRGAGRGVRAEDLTHAARSIAATGRLTIEALLTGMLEATRETRFKDPNAPHATSLLVRRLARNGGVGGDRTKLVAETLHFVQECLAVMHGLRYVDPEMGRQQFVVYVEAEQIRVRPFGTTGAVEFREDGQTRDLGPFRGNSIQPASAVGAGPLRDLEHLLNSGAVERDFQDFFEEHPSFLRALGPYADVHPQVVLDRAGEGPLIPDFFLEKLDSRFCDLCELKRADVDLVRRQHNRVRFRDAVMEAIAQLETYRDWFEESGRRDALVDTFGLTAFRPQAVLVIGRRASFATELERLATESRIPGWVRLTTYDDVLLRARQWRNSAPVSSA